MYNLQVSIGHYLEAFSIFRAALAYFRNRSVTWGRISCMFSMLGSSFKKLYTSIERDPNRLVESVLVLGRMCQLDCMGSIVESVCFA